MRIELLPHRADIWRKVRSGEMGPNFVSATHCCLLAHEVIDPERLRGALAILAARHQVLTGRIVERDGSAFVDQIPLAPIPLRLIDLSHLSPLQAEQKAQQFVGGAVWGAFEADDAALCAAFCAALPSGRTAFGFVIHHLVADGLSVQIACGELIAHYDAIGGGYAPAPRQVPPDHSLALYNERFRRWMVSSDASDAAAYWDRTLAGAPATRLPPRADADGPGPTIEMARTLSFRWEWLTRGDLHRCAVAHGVSAMHIVALANLAALWRLTSAADQTLALLGLGRTDPAVLRTVGFFAEPSALRLQLSPLDTLLALLHRLRDQYNASYRHRTAPWAAVVDRFDAIGASPVLPQLNYYEALGNDRPIAPEPAPRFEAFLTPPCAPQPTSSFALPAHYIQFSASQRGLEGHIRFLPSLYDEAAARRFLGVIEWLLTRAVSRELDFDTTRLADLPTDISAPHDQALCNA